MIAGGIEDHNGYTSFAKCPNFSQLSNHQSWQIFHRDFTDW